MSRDSYEVRRCDRCGAEADGRIDPDLSAWGRIAAVANNPQTGKILAVGQDGQDTGDLCPGCATDLFDWLAGKPADLVPPPKPREAIALPMNISEIAAVIEKSITEQAWFAINELKDQPSQLLDDGADMTHCLEGKDRRARKAATEIFNKIKPKESSRHE